MRKPVIIARSPQNWRLVTPVCVCGWHGRTRRHYGDAHREKLRHRRQCPYRHDIRRMTEPLASLPTEPAGSRCEQAAPEGLGGGGAAACPPPRPSAERPHRPPAPDPDPDQR